MEEREFKELIDRYQKGIATPEEAKIVDAFFDSYRNEGNDWPTDIMGEPEDSEYKIFRRVLSKHEFAKPVRRLSFSTVWKAAAIFLVAFAIGYSTYLYKFQTSEPTVIATDFVAGGDKAKLRLADGTEIELDSVGSTSIPQQGTSSIFNSNGKIAYQASNSSAEVLYNTIATPRGGQYQVQLADGSKVWLNALSSLRYPTAFSGTDRVVELTGEAYFEITKNAKMPFKVRIPSGAEVEVLGTHFNVMAYEEESAIKTTLLEGSVRITSADHISALLEPNQQAQITKEGNVAVVKNYKVSEAIAWKNSMFVFKNTELDVIMRQISRWYDVEVIYKDDVRSREFIGRVSRMENASAVLDLLELTGAVDFEIQGRKIIVKKGKN